ncbi:hypothetical protein [Roseovarius sp.]|uniref:hypothetical protein n=1 Tax=Roseovarius sp. TaxID=1486281 RepID=UPI003BABD5A4
MGRNISHLDFRRSPISGDVRESDVDAAFRRVSRQLYETPAPIGEDAAERPEANYVGIVQCSSTSVKSWPDYLLATCGVSFVTMVAIHQFLDRPLSLCLLLISVGGFLIAAAAKSSIKRTRILYRSHEEWFDSWQHGVTADIITGIGIAMATFGLGLTCLTLLSP